MFTYRRSILIISCACASVALGVHVLAAAQPAQESPQGVSTKSAAQQAIESAESAFAIEDWAQAVHHYRAALANGADSGLLHMRLGYALHMQGLYEEAMPSHLRAAHAMNKEIRVDGLYNCACAMARLGKREQALDFLAKAIDAGFGDANQLVKDPDMDPLRTDARYMALAASIGKTPTLHKWMTPLVGTWQRTDAQGAVVQILTITQPLKGSSGLATTSVHAGGEWTGMMWPEAQSRSWRWSQCDGIGTSRMLIGVRTDDGAFEFTGNDQSPVGQSSHIRLTYRTLENGNIRETAEVSINGTEWRLYHDAEYVKTEASAAEIR